MKNFFIALSILLTLASCNSIPTSNLVSGTVPNDTIPLRGFSKVSVHPDKLLKINTIVAANIDGTNDADITVYVTTAGATTALYHLAKTITVPADSSLVITSKDTSFYLEEDRAIRALASAAGDISLMVSYEELDDA